MKAVVWLALVAVLPILAPACGGDASSGHEGGRSGSGGAGTQGGGTGGGSGAPGAGAGAGGTPGTAGAQGMGGTADAAGAAGAAGSAGVVSSGGSDGTGGRGTAGASGPSGARGGGAGMAGIGNVAGADGGMDAGGGAGGAGGTDSGGAPNAEGPCDIYRDAGQPCVAAYSTVRRLLSTYTGPLYQVRSGSSEQNTGSGGETHDIGQTMDGFADGAAVDAACADTICTVSLLYDQSGKGSHLPVAKKGIPFGGPNAATDDFESNATKESLTLSGHKVYSLYMEPRQGYRLARVGDGMPRQAEPQGIYMLADGTRAGVGCCFDFGNAPPNAQTFYDTTALFFGSGVGSSGAGEGPWFMMDSHAYVSAGSSQGSPNPNNPSLKVKFALGFLKTEWPAPPGNWALRMADATTASALTTASQGAMPRRTSNAGAVILGVSSDNGNASSGTFYEGAIVAGFPADETELAVLRNVKAAGYGR